MAAWMEAVPRDRAGLASAALHVAVVAPAACVLVVSRPGIASLLFVVLAPVATLALLWARRLLVPRSVVLGAALLVVAGLLLSTVVHDAPAQRLLLTLLWRGVLVLWFLYLAALAVALDPRGAERLILVLAAACAASAAANLFLYFRLPLEALPDEAQVRFAPVFGLLGGRFATTAGATYAVFAGAALALALGPRQGHAVRAVAILSAVVLGVALALTQTRGAYLAIAAAAVAVAACQSRRAQWAVLAALLAAVLVGLLYQPLFEVVVERGASYRPAAWAHFLPAFLEHPLLGIGQREPIRILLEDMEIHHPHNILLSAQVRGGLLAFAGLLVMIVAALVWAWRFARRTGQAAVLAMVTALAVASLFDYEARVTPTDWIWLTIWVPLGLAAGCEMMLRRTAAEPSADGPRAS